MPELQTLITGLDFGEGPRWHDGPPLVLRLLPAPRLRGHGRRRTRDHARARRPPERSRLAARRSDARCVDAGQEGPARRARRDGGGARRPLRHRDRALQRHGRGGGRQRLRRQLRLRDLDTRHAAERRARARPSRRHRRGRCRRHGVSERERDHPRRSHADRRRVDGSALRGVRHPCPTARSSIGASGRSSPTSRPTAARSTPTVRSGSPTRSGPTSPACAKVARSPIASTSGRATYACTLGGEDGRTLFIAVRRQLRREHLSPGRHRRDSHHAGRRSARRACRDGATSRGRSRCARSRASAFRSFGVSEHDARTAAELLIEADLLGFDTHGIAHLVGHPGLRARPARRSRAGERAVRDRARVGGHRAGRRARRARAW